MCGLVTILDPAGRLTPADLTAVDTLRSRGPHDERTWVNEAGTVGMGHTRLAIVGIANGAQPIRSGDGDVVAVVTGEFYPSRQLRRSLQAKGHRFRTDSDSELIVHLYEDDPEGFACRLDGEFAFVLWDRRRARVLAGRDRFGVKPLFTARSGDRWIVASLAKTLFAAGVDPRWDEQSYADHLAMSVLPGRTMFEGVRQVEPGQIITWSLDGSGALGCPSERSYWTMPAPGPNRHPAGASVGLAAKLGAAVADRLVADVPVAVHLSGGLDSTVIAGLAAARQPSTMFTVRFTGPSDEGEKAARTAAALGAEHFEIAFDMREYLETRHRTMATGEMVQENGHGSARLLLSEYIAGEGYRVALAGEGADELFFGYGSLQRDLELGHDDLRRAETADRHRRQRERLPTLARQTLDRLDVLPTWILERQAQVVLPLLPLLDADFRERCLLARPSSQRLDRLLDDVASLSLGAASSRLFLRTWFTNYLLSAERLDLDGKVEVRLPYLADAVAEAALSAPVESHRPSPHPKPLLRHAGLPVPASWTQPETKIPFHSQPLVALDPVLDCMIADVEGGLLDAVPMLDEVACLAYLRSVRDLQAARRVGHDRVIHLVYSTGLLGVGLDLRG